MSVSPNMALPIPVVGVIDGPEWAESINSCLTLIDQHDHSPGYGVPITPSGMNISSDLSFGGNDLTNARSLRMRAQSSPLTGASPDLGCLYVSGSDLYFNDISGNQVRITQSGAVAGTPGSIANLASPASASYVSASTKFVFQSAANTSAYLDCSSLLIRNLTANSYACTLAAPSAMGSNISITLPSPPAANNTFVTMSTGGGLAATYSVDNSTLELSGSSVQVKNSGITTAKINNGAVTAAKLADLTYDLADSSGSASTSSTSFTDVTNQEVSITTTGRPVMVGIRTDGSGGPGNIGGQITGLAAGADASIQTAYRILRNGTDSFYVGQAIAVGKANSSGVFVIEIPPSALSLLDITASAGTTTYKLQYYVVGSGGTAVAFATNLKLYAYEL